MRHKGLSRTGDAMTGTLIMFLIPLVFTGIMYVALSVITAILWVLKQLPGIALLGVLILAVCLILKRW
jgi:hypothetical protein